MDGISPRPELDRAKQLDDSTGDTFVSVQAFSQSLCFRSGFVQYLRLIAPLSMLLI
jgi:hypothetical protein